MENTDEHLRGIREKQRGIIVQRLDRLAKAERDSSTVEAQVEALEELLRLLKEQVVTLAEPEEFTAQLDGLLNEMDVVEHTVSELESSFETFFDRELEKAEEQKRLES